MTIASEEGANRTASKGFPSSASLLALKAAAGIVDTSSIQAQSYDQYRYVAEPLQERWRRELAANETSVQVSSLLHRKDNSRNVLIVAGSTRGSGKGLGETGDYSMSGFITIIDTSLGLPIRSRRMSSSATTSDHILGLCQDSTNSIYAVGMTNGRLSKQQAFVGTQSKTSFQAFLQKLDGDTLSVIWTQTLAAATDALHPGSIHGLSCAVTPDGSYVYLAGIAKAGAAISLDGETLATTSAGLDDIFVAQYKSGDGTLRFAKQLGTKRNDQLAAGNGAVCDKYGNVILLVNTQGSFLKPDEQENPYVNNVVILSIDHINGNHVIFPQSETLPTAIPTTPINTGIAEYGSPTRFLVMVGVLSVSVIITLVTVLIYCYRRRNNSWITSSNDYLRPMSEDDDAQRKECIHDIDPECATSNVEDIASTKVSEEKDENGSHFYRTTSRAVSSHDALIPLSTHADEADNAKYMASLRRLELVEQDETPEKCYGRNGPDARHARAEDARSLLPKQTKKGKLERRLKSIDISIN